MATSAGGCGGDRIGVIVGLKAEARCLRRLDVLIGCSGARPERARAEAERLRAAGVAGLVSFGLAGGLAPALRAGDLVLAATVVLPDGRRLPTDAAWRGRLLALLQGVGIECCEDALAGSDRLIASPAAKAALRARHAAGAVDMESHGVAVVAGAAGLPFVVLRAIADPADRAIPAVAQGALGPDGALRLVAAIRGLRRPGELAAVLGLGWASARGLARLGRVAALAAPDFAFR